MCGYLLNFKADQLQLKYQSTSPVQKKKKVSEFFFSVTLKCIEFSFALSKTHISVPPVLQVRLKIFINIFL